MEPNKDFKELLALLNATHVEFVIVGAYALARELLDSLEISILDVLVALEPNNAERVLRALDAFGFGSLGLGAMDFSGDDRIVQLGVPPVRIDIMTSITGITWDRAWQN